MTETLRILSLGAGVQSSTVLLLACQGELCIDAAIFADTQWEPAAVYRHLDWLEAEAAKAGIGVHRVTAGDIFADTMAKAAGAGTRFASLPLRVRNADGSDGILRRQCTKEYKIQPVRRRLRALLEDAGAKRADLVFGISLDEVQRMRDSDVKYITHRYPLVDRRMTRVDCLRWMAEQGYPTPSKSACIGCPYHDDATWRRMRIEQPNEWSQAVQFDAAIRTLPRIDGEAFVHRSLQPLDQVDFSNEQDKGQLDMFADECEGMCGV